VTARPNAVAGALVGVAVRLLPRSDRDRYDDEFRADLCFLPRIRQIPQAVGLLAGAFPLRSALLDADPSRAKSVTYWRCRLGRHHYLVVGDDNPENRRSSHLECSRRLKFKESKDRETPTEGTSGPVRPWFVNRRL
jgi:hypothetical protein